MPGNFDSKPSLEYVLPRQPSSQAHVDDQHLREKVSLNRTAAASEGEMTSPFFGDIDPMKPVKPSFHPSTSPQLQQSLSCNTVPTQHTQEPKIVGTSVLGMKYKDGVILAADNLGINVGEETNVSEFR
jgi:hypothetical protein